MPGNKKESLRVLRRRAAEECIQRQLAFENRARLLAAAAPYMDRKVETFHTTLDKVVTTSDWTVKEKEKYATYLMLLYLLCSVQMDFAKDLEYFLKDKGKFSIEVENTHRQIQDLIRKNGYENAYINNLSAEKIETITDDMEKLKDLILEWAGLPAIHNKGITGVNLNEVAKDAIKFSGLEGSPEYVFADNISSKVSELKKANSTPSSRIKGYTKIQEKAIDVVISTLALLTSQGTDINYLLKDRMDYLEHKTK